MTKPHLSASQLDMYCRCPEQYRRRYMEQEILPPGISMVRGISVHRAAESNFTQKIESHRDMPVKHIEEIAVESMRAQVTEGQIAYTVDEMGRGIDNVVGDAIDQVSHMARVHAVQQAPEYQPVSVEGEFRIPLPGVFDLVGRIDLIDDKDRVVDLKTAQKSKPASEADSSVQLTIYAAAFQVQNGRQPSDIRLDVLVAGKRDVKRQVLSTSRDGNDIEALANRIDAVSEAIQAGIFPPASPGHWCCSAKWCGYYRSCRFVNGAKQGDSE